MTALVSATVPLLLQLECFLTAQRNVAEFPGERWVSRQTPRPLAYPARVATMAPGSGRVTVGEHPSVPEVVRVRSLEVPSLARSKRGRVRLRSAVLGTL